MELHDVRRFDPQKQHLAKQRDNVDSRET
jgi:hypothetical protein